MMNLLIKETDLKKEVPVTGTFGYDKIKPEIRRVQNRMIKWILGTTLTNSLAAAYQDGTPSTEQSDLLEYVHPAIANLATWMFIDKASVEIGNSGIVTHFGENEKTASENRIENLKRSYLNSGYDSLEDLIEFLEDNTGIYAWNTQNTRELFISTAAVFQTYVDIKSSRLMYMSLLPIIRRVEKDQIRGTISGDLFDAIKAEILADGEPSATNNKLSDNIRGAIAHFSYADLIIEKSMISDDQGFHLINNSVTGNSPTFSPAEESRLRIRRDHHLAQANKYLKNLSDYLYANADDYPLYKDSGLYKEGEEPSDHMDNDEDSPIFTML